MKNNQKTEYGFWVCGVFGGNKINVEIVLGLIY